MTDALATMFLMCPYPLVTLHCLSRYNKKPPRLQLHTAHFACTTGKALTQVTTTPRGEMCPQKLVCSLSKNDDMLKSIRLAELLHFSTSILWPIVSDKGCRYLRYVGSLGSKRTSESACIAAKHSFKDLYLHASSLPIDTCHFIAV